MTFSTGEIEAIDRSDEMERAALEKRWEDEKAQMKKATPAEKTDRNSDGR